MSTTVLPANGPRCVDLLGHRRHPGGQQPRHHLPVARLQRPLAHLARHLGPHVAHALQRLLAGVEERRQVGEGARQLAGGGLAHLRDAEREEEAAQRGRPGPARAPPACSAAAFSGSSGGFFFSPGSAASFRGAAEERLPGGERNRPEVGEVLHQPLGHQLGGQLVAQPLDVHGAALGEVAEPAGQLGAAGRAGAAPRLLPLLAHHVGAADRALGREAELHLVRRCAARGAPSPPPG